MTNRADGADIKETKNTETEQDQSPTLGRRTFVIATVAAAACACCGAAEDAEAQTTRPATKPTTKPSTGASGGTVDVGALADFAKDGVNDSFAKSKKLLVIRNEGKLYASSATCTHKGCTLNLKDGGIVCKCHGSSFSNFGTPIKGPARDSLVRYAISVNDGKVLVNTAKSFREKQWEDPASFIDVSKA